MKLTAKVEKLITNDWHSLLPKLSIYKPRHLLRRAGPLLVGVCLDRDSGGDRYKPCFHCHFLGKEFPVVSLTLCSQLRSAAGGPDYVEVKYHREKFEDAARRLHAQSPLPLDDSPIELGAVVEAYHLHMTTPLGSRQRAILSSDVIGLLVLCDQSEAAEAELERTLREENESIFQTFGGKNEFREKMIRCINDPAKLTKIVELQIQELDVADICHSMINCEMPALRRSRSEVK